MPKADACTQPLHVGLDGTVITGRNMDWKENLHSNLPNQSHASQEVASVTGVMRAESVPLGITTPGQPSISSTTWRSVSHQTNKTYCFDMATRPNTFWMSPAKLNLQQGALALELPLADGQIYSGEVSGESRPATPFHFLPAGPS